MEQIEIIIQNIFYAVNLFYLLRLVRTKHNILMC